MRAHKHEAKGMRLARPLRLEGQSNGGRTMASGNTTTNHDEIRKWVEAHGGCPARVKRTGRGSDMGVLRIDYPGFSGQQTLETISWDDWFAAFEENNLAFVYGGNPKSRFSKLVAREEGQSGTGRRRSATSRGRSAAKRTTAKRGAAAKSGGAKRTSAKRTSSTASGGSKKKSASRTGSRATSRAAAGGGGRKRAQSSSGASTSRKTTRASAGRVSGKKSGSTSRGGSNGAPSKKAASKGGKRTAAKRGGSAKRGASQR